jgi:hypothetical protein
VGIHYSHRATHDTKLSLPPRSRNPTGLSYSSTIAVSLIPLFSPLLAYISFLRGVAYRNGCLTRPL